MKQEKKADSSNSRSTDSAKDRHSHYDPDVYWNDTQLAYPHYPTIRHRKRFICRELERNGLHAGKTVFDYGCGEGGVLKLVGERFHLTPSSLAGCDIAETAVAAARVNTGSTRILHDLYPHTDDLFDFVICSEVIEHSTDYEEILKWIHSHLNKGGVLILTTQSGKVHRSDEYTGHTQHFQAEQLRVLLEKMRFSVSMCRTWGFPFFTLQKYATDFRFDEVRDKYLEGRLDLRKRLVFSLAYWAYFVHDFIPLGPQIYITATTII